MTTIPLTTARRDALSRVTSKLRIYPTSVPEGQRELQIRRLATGEVVLTNDADLDDAQARRVIFVQLSHKDLLTNFPELA